MLLFQNGNRAAAIRWQRQAADAGEARAMLLYGTALYNGDGVAPDPAAAYAYVSRAAAQGLPAARATLADLEAAMSLSQRQEGVAKARAMVGVKRAVAAAPVKPVAIVKPKPAQVAAAGAWRIQLGAFGQRATAEALFARLAPRLAGRQAYYTPVGKVVRPQAGPFASRAEASAACARLVGQACFAVAPR